MLRTTGYRRSAEGKIRPITRREVWSRWHPDTAGTKLRGVARRPARGSLKNFFGDLRDLLRFGTLKATVQEFVRDDALGLAAQLAFYLILAIFPFILFLRRHPRRLLELRARSSSPSSSTTSGGSCRRRSST